jgi:magnesium transporter
MSETGITVEAQEVGTGKCVELTGPSTLEDAREEIARLRMEVARQGAVIKRTGLGDATGSPAGDDRDDTSLPSYFARSVLGHVRVRLPWLAALLLLQSVSAVILHGFDEMLSKHLAIAMFVPMIVGTGGNAGNQPGVIVTRALDSDRENLLANIGQLLSKEARIGALQASILSACAFGRVLIEFPGDVRAALAIALATFTVVFVSVFLGVGFSVGIDACRLDPAAGSAPLLTTISDILGILTLCVMSALIMES